MLTKSNSTKPWEKRFSESTVPSVDVNFFDSESTTTIPEDIEVKQKEEWIQRTKEEKAMIKNGYSRVMEETKV